MRKRPQVAAPLGGGRHVTWRAGRSHRPGAARWQDENSPPPRLGLSRVRARPQGSRTPAAAAASPGSCRYGETGRREWNRHGTRPGSKGARSAAGPWGSKALPAGRRPVPRVGSQCSGLQASWAEDFAEAQTSLEDAARRKLCSSRVWGGAEEPAVQHGIGDMVLPEVQFFRCPLASYEYLPL
ncbi:unnamed protein product [Eretmochelys imbricata]